MIIFFGKIEAVIKEDHPQFRYGEMPEGFSDLTLSPSKKYAADIKFFEEIQSSPVKSVAHPDTMLRIVDLTTKKFSHFWFDHKIPFNFCQAVDKKVIWMNDESILVVYAESEGDTTLVNYRIDHKQSVLEETWRREMTLSNHWITANQSLVKIGAEEYVVVHNQGAKIDGAKFQFVPLFNDKAPMIEIKCPATVNYKGEDLTVLKEFGFILNEFAYFGARSKDREADFRFPDKRTHLIRIRINDIDMKNPEWIKNSVHNAEVLEMPGDFGLTEAWNNDWLIFAEWKSEKSKYLAVDVKNFTWKSLDLVKNPLIVFNHFEDRPYPLKDTPLKYRFHQDILGSSDDATRAEEAIVFGKSEKDVLCSDDDVTLTEEVLGKKVKKQGRIRSFFGKCFI